MYCPNCGKENQDNAGFCASCGRALGKSGKNFDFKTFFIKYKYIVIALAVLLVILLLVASKDSPEKAAKKFMKAFINCDADVIVDSFYINDDYMEDFMEEYDTTKANVKKEMKKDFRDECRDYNDFKDAKFKIINSETKGKKAMVDVKITKDDDSTVITLKMVKINGKWLIDLEQADKDWL